jgi:hypothetical protein
MPRAAPAPRKGNGQLNASPHPDRLAQLEEAIALIQKTLDVQFTRIAAIQADLDLLKANKGNDQAK